MCLNLQGIGLVLYTVSPESGFRMLCEPDMFTYLVYTVSGIHPSASREPARVLSVVGKRGIRPYSIPIFFLTRKISPTQLLLVDVSARELVGPILNRERGLRRKVMIETLLKIAIRFHKLSAARQRCQRRGRLIPQRLRRLIGKQGLVISAVGIVVIIEV